MDPTPLGVFPSLPLSSPAASPWETLSSGGSEPRGKGWVMGKVARPSSAASSLGMRGATWAQLKCQALLLTCSAPLDQSLPSSVSPAKIPQGLGVYLKPLGWWLQGKLPSWAPERPIVGLGFHQRPCVLDKHPRGFQCQLHLAGQSLSSTDVGQQGGGEKVARQGWTRSVMRRPWGQAQPL